MTYQALIDGYVKRLTESTSRRSEFLKITNEINGLTYEKDGSPIDNDYKIKIYNEIKDRIISQRRLREGTQVFSASNDDFLDLVDTVVDKLKGK